jgi:hypothetical protein
VPAGTKYKGSTVVAKDVPLISADTNIGDKPKTASKRELFDLWRHPSNDSLTDTKIWLRAWDFFAEVKTRVAKNIIKLLCGRLSGLWSGP